ncbi:MAG: chemotaxis protein CheD [Bacillota bacterium]|uniref:chemotaxis protein CheD n=1 Tax=Bacillus sp. RO2 TaxID=2723913 RepID=UPI00145EA90D|nr:chemotaxis protein CheD [Bacillus sp. RO2]MEA3320130.1 chemotaxis protein CheD [Bacillota bacterium]NMH74897.1 chemotaxis protein CheD [Bacillus sp. RO2]
MMSVEAVIKVGIAEMGIVKAPQLIRTAGLGSCVGVVIYDTTTKIAGMVHIMLPDSNLTRQTPINADKYADTGILHLVETLLLKGIKSYSMKAKIAGGAQMFQFSSASADMMRIGPRNVEAVKEKLAALHIPLISEDCGGNNGRTIEFNPENGKLMIKTVNKGVCYI